MSTIYCQADTRLHTPTLVIQVSQCASDSQKSKYQRVFIVNFRACYLSLLEKRSQREYDANKNSEKCLTTGKWRRYSPLKRVNDADVSARCSAAMNSKISAAPAAFFAPLRQQSCSVGTKVALIQQQRSGVSYLFVPGLSSAGKACWRESRLMQYTVSGKKNRISGPTPTLHPLSG